MEEGVSAEKGVRYRHYKGGVYTVLTIAAHADTKAPYVVYEKEGTGEVYVRDLLDWEKHVLVAGNVVPRFSRVDACASS